MVKHDADRHLRADRGAVRQRHPVIEPVALVVEFDAGDDDRRILLLRHLHGGADHRHVLRIEQGNRITAPPGVFEHFAQ